MKRTIKKIMCYKSKHLDLVYVIHYLNGMSSSDDGLMLRKSI